MSSKSTAAMGENGGDIMEKEIKEKGGKRKMSFQLSLSYLVPSGTPGLCVECSDVGRQHC